jgi:REP element-mobilizing transposase RayT
MPNHVHLIVTRRTDEDGLRATFRRVRARHPFTIEAAVILPDHLGPQIAVLKYAPSPKSDGFLSAQPILRAFR